MASIGRTKITDIAGRTMKPDGTIVEVEKNSVFDRVLVQAQGVKQRAKSFCDARCSNSAGDRSRTCAIPRPA